MMREDQQHNCLPLMDSAALNAQLPRALLLSGELEARDYFELSIVEQWRLMGTMLLEHAREADDPLQPALLLSQNPEARVRFHSCGLLAQILLEQPTLALHHLLPLAGDSDRRVSEAAQAFGLRPLLQKHGAEMVSLLLPWTEHELPHVRRAVVEAARPRGMWVSQLKWAVDAPALLLPLLEELRFESESYPANAVGNSLNDISKNHPKLVMDVLASWLAEVNPGEQLDRIVSKGIRTLIKQGNPAAMRLCGFDELKVEVDGEIRDVDSVRPNSAINFVLNIHNQGRAADAKLVYEISTTGKKFNRPRRHKFQSKTLRLPSRDTLTVRCRERIYDQKAAKLIDGVGAVKCWLNGQEVIDMPFYLQRKRK